MPVVSHTELTMSTNSDQNQAWLKIASQATRAYEQADAQDPKTLEALESAITAMQNFPAGPMTAFRDQQVKLCQDRLENARKGW
jgi:hypothetical protein